MGQLSSKSVRLDADLEYGPVFSVLGDDSKVGYFPHIVLESDLRFSSDAGVSSVGVVPNPLI